MRYTLQCFIAAWALLSFNAHSVDLRHLEYDEFQLASDCVLKSPIKNTYTIDPDSGDMGLQLSFRLPQNNINRINKSGIVPQIKRRDYEISI